MTRVWHWLNWQLFLYTFNKYHIFHGQDDDNKILSNLMVDQAKFSHAGKYKCNRAHNNSHPLRVVRQPTPPPTPGKHKKQQQQHRHRFDGGGNARIHESTDTMIEMDDPIFEFRTTVDDENDDDDDAVPMSSAVATLPPPPPPPFEEKPKQHHHHERHRVVVEEDLYRPTEVYRRDDADAERLSEAIEMTNGDDDAGDDDSTLVVTASSTKKVSIENDIAEDAEDEDECEQCDDIAAVVVSHVANTSTTTMMGNNKKMDQLVDVSSRNGETIRPTMSSTTTSSYQNVFLLDKQPPPPSNVRLQMENIEQTTAPLSFTATTATVAAIITYELMGEHGGKNWILSLLM